MRWNWLNDKTTCISFSLFSFRVQVDTAENNVQTRKPRVFKFFLSREIKKLSQN